MPKCFATGASTRSGYSQLRETREARWVPHWPHITCMSGATEYAGPRETACQARISAQSSRRARLKCVSERLGLFSMFSAKRVSFRNALILCKLEKRSDGSKDVWSLVRERWVLGLSWATRVRRGCNQSLI